MAYYRDSVGNTYSRVPPRKDPPKAGPGRGKRHGRNKKKPSNQRYLAQRRWEKNKARRAARRLRELAKAAARR